MKKFWIDTSIGLRKKTGIGMYLLMILKILKSLDINYESINANIKENQRRKSIRLTLWQNTILYLKTLFFQPKTIMFVNCFMPYFTFKNVKYVTVVHDLCSFHEGYEKPAVAFTYRYGIRTTVKKANTIIAVSESTKNELIKKFNIDPKRIKVVYNTVPEHFFNIKNNLDVLKKYNIQPQKYILSVATINRHKNIPALIKAFESISAKYPDLYLVLVGRMGNEQREQLTNHPNVIFTDYISDEEIPVLYKNAMLFMYPSLYEGFGIPLIEAQYCGCPVLCSDIPVFREIAGNSAEFCEPVSSKIAERLEVLINDKSKCDEYRKLGYENVKRFDIDIITQQLKSAINS